VELWQECRSLLTGRHYRPDPRPRLSAEGVKQWFTLLIFYRDRDVLSILPFIAENLGISAFFRVSPAGNAAIGHHLLPISAAISAHLQG
jgi:hypothetical protein